MVKFMKKVPAGTLLVPMFISALINTIFPNLFDIGGATQFLLGGEGVTFIVGLLTFISATLLEVSTIKDIFKKQGILMVAKIIFCVIFGYFIIRYLGDNTIFGISSLALVAAICSTNPGLYLALANEYGKPCDPGAFGLLGILSIPAFPMIIFAISLGGDVDLMSIFSSLLPLFLGIIIGNLDPEFRKLTQPALGILMPFLGWGLGASLNIIDALKAGLSGVILVAIFYFTMTLFLYIVERKLMKRTGANTFAMSTVAGVSIAAISSIVASNPSLQQFALAAQAQLTFAVLITSTISPMLMKWALKAHAKDWR